MENASKALIMAASVLLGVMIISVGVALFNSFSGFSTDIATQIDKKQISQFNSNYYKYYGKITITNKDGKDEVRPIEVTAHDIVSIANNAKQNNIKYELENQTQYNENINYVQVTVKKENTNFEKATEKDYTDFLKNNALIGYEEGSVQAVENKYYQCTDIKTNVLGKVMYIEFAEYK